MAKTKAYQKHDHIKVWKKHFGEIPKDSDGRSFEIHHVDGDASNNNIDNLVCVSIAEHYQIHKSQCDWGAAFMIARRMDIPPSDIAEIARMGTLKRISEGKHNFQDPNFPRSLDHNIGFVVAIDTRTQTTVRISKEDFEKYDYYIGVNAGRKQNKVHSNRGHNKGKTWSHVNKEQPKKCRYCDFQGRASHLSRYHNERCKHKNESSINQLQPAVQGNSG